MTIPQVPDNSAEDALADEEPEGWDDPQSWEQLLYTIKYKRCTPFLGAGACAGVLPLGRRLAQEWAEEYDYPFPDSDNLPRVAQFVSIMKGPLLPRLRIVEAFEGKSPDFSHPHEPHRVMAELNLPVYITTNYDSFMLMALHSLGRRALQECCQWHNAKLISKTREKGVGSTVSPTADEPVVFHFHGYLEDPNSMVLTEDDYLNFLINTSEVNVIPSHIEAALANDRAFLFVGYSLEDITFKVLFRKFADMIASSPGDRHIAVQLHNVEGLSEEQKRKQREYLKKLFSTQKVKVYWGKAQSFTRSLQKRWEEFK